jgi:predicted metal-binding protein
MPPDADGRTRGAALADAVEAALAAVPAAQRPTLRRVQCLTGCLRPCNVALRAAGKYSLRFSRLGAADAAAVLAFAALYGASTDGDVPEAQWPDALRGRNTVRVPPPPS